jgi:hypothetical protein
MAPALCHADFANERDSSALRGRRARRFAPDTKAGLSSELAS